MPDPVHPDQVIGISAEVPPPNTVVRTRSNRSASQQRERQLPKFPAGLFNLREWDLGRDFESLEEIGRGKDTIIYKGLCRKALGTSNKVGQAVAVKVYFKNKVSHTKLRAIKREVAIMMFMQRQGVPNIVKAYTAFSDDLHYYIIMEYCPGGDLLEWILERKKALHERDALSSIVIPLLNCLCHMHSLGIIHRDIKLENIFLGENLKVLVGDFGLTMSTFQESAISPVGTVEYMAPEVLALPPVDMILSKAVDPRSIRANDEKVDIWALGVTLFELVTGKLPFNGKDKNAIKGAIRNYQMSSFPGCVSIGCRNIIMDMLSYKAEDRPSAFTLKRRINRFLNGDPPSLQPMLGLYESNEDSQLTQYDIIANCSSVEKNHSTDVSGSAASMDCSVSGEAAFQERKPRVFGRVLKKISGGTRKFFQA